MHARSGIGWGGALLVVLGLATARSQDRPADVLYVVVDDLRPELACLGDRHMVCRV